MKKPFSTEDLEKEIKLAESKTNLKEIKLGEKSLGFQPEFPLEFLNEMENKRVKEEVLKERQRLKAEVEKKIEKIYQELKENEDEALDKMPDEVAIKLQSGFLLGYADALVKFNQRVKKELGIE